MTEPSACRLTADLVAGKVSVLEVVDACLARIAADEDRVRAWAFLDPEHARTRARELDATRRAGRPLGPLFGLPVGIKDIFDTCDMPTENGSILCQGRRPRRDATVIARLRTAGAVVMGKTVTAELACSAPGKTRNPHDPARTPGGSSSGSAAAVAAGMVPLALGSQTNGSTIRPASFCGIVGFKPSLGLVSRAGVLRTSSTLDHVGLFARSLEDVGLLADALAGHDPADPTTLPWAAPGLRSAAGRALPVPPRLAFVRGPTWADAEPTTHEAFADLVEQLGPHVHEVALPQDFADFVAVHRTIWTAELAFELAHLHARGSAQMSPQLNSLIAHGQATTAVRYQQALAMRDRYIAALEALLHEHDAILTPAAPGEAPLGLETTGSPVFCTLWSLTGLPALSLPLLQGPHGLPLGCQLVAAPGDDARLLGVARWLETRLGGDRP